MTDTSKQAKPGFSQATAAAELQEDPSFAKALFHGRILSDRVVPYPDLDPEEQEILKMTSEALRKLAQEIDLEQIEAQKRVPEEVLQKFKEMGVFGAIIPPDYGGFGLSNAGYVQLLTELTFLDLSLTATIGAHQSIGMKALLLFGTEAQKQQYLPRLATGEMLAAFALTEPEAGSDAGNVRSTATLATDGSHYVLNGSKIWITNGGIADFFTVFARTPDGPGSDRKNPITAFIVTRDMAGFSSGPEEQKMGLLGSSTVALNFDGIKVPLENVLGEPGHGFKVALAVLNNGRLGLAGACALGMRRIINMAMEHALGRKQFDRPLAEFDLVQGKFANILIENYAAEAMARVTTSIMDGGKYDYSLESAISKVFSTEALWRGANECLQIAGGTGYMKEYGYEKIVRDSRIFMIWEGANDILRLFIGLSGMQGPGEQLKEVAEALRQPMQDVVHSLGVLGNYGVRWLQRRVSAPGKLEGIHEIFESEVGIVERYTAQLAQTVETLLQQHGKEVLQQQFAVKRIADITIDLYATTCALSRASKAVNASGEKQAEQDILLARAFTRKARRRMAENLRRMTKSDDAAEKRIAQNFYEAGGAPPHGFFL